MDMIALTVVLLLVCIFFACAVCVYKVVKYRDSHLKEWSRKRKRVSPLPL